MKFIHILIREINYKYLKLEIIPYRMTSPSFIFFKPFNAIKFVSARRGSLIFTKPWQDQGLVKFGMTVQFYGIGGRSGDSKDIFIFNFMGSNRRFVLLIYNYLNVIPNEVRNPLLFLRIANIAICI